MGSLQQMLVNGSSHPTSIRTERPRTTRGPIQAPSAFSNPLTFNLTIWVHLQQAERPPLARTGAIARESFSRIRDLAVNDKPALATPASSAAGCASKVCLRKLARPRLQSDGEGWGPDVQHLVPGGGTCSRPAEAHARYAQLPTAYQTCLKHSLVTSCPCVHMLAIHPACDMLPAFCHSVAFATPTGLTDPVPAQRDVMGFEIRIDLHWQQAAVRWTPSDTWCASHLWDIQDYYMEHASRTMLHRKRGCVMHPCLC